MGASFDDTEVRGLVKTFDDATGGPAMAEVEKVVFKGAMNIKRGAARGYSGMEHLRRLPASVDFDTFRTLRGPAAEIGPNHRKPQGNLAHIPEYGTPTSAPHPAMAPAAAAELPRFERALADLAVKAIEP